VNFPELVCNMSISLSMYMCENLVKRGPDFFPSVESV
jgi:hypothetical protein